MEEMGSRTPRSGREAPHPLRLPHASLPPLDASPGLARRRGKGAYWGKGRPEVLVAGLWGEPPSVGVRGRV